MRLGDLVERALSSVGLTKDRVEAWLGRECHCRERQERLNQLGNWARRVLSGKAEGAAEHLDRLTGG